MATAWASSIFVSLDWENPARSAASATVMSLAVRRPRSRWPSSRRTAVGLRAASVMAASFLVAASVPQAGPGAGLSAATFVKSYREPSCE